jgi:Ku70/Ku80 beta-barrel domain
VLIANQSNSLAKKGIAALVNAMKSLNKYAIVRYVFRANSTPKLCALVPQVGKDHECLFMV